MDNEYKIQADNATLKRVAQVICGEIKSSLKENEKIYKRAKRNENMYSQITRWMEEGKVCNNPWPDAADYFIPLVEWIVDAIHARVLTMLFSQEPYLEAKGVESSDVDKASGVTDFVDMAFREMVKLYDNTNYFFKQIIKLPFAVLKYDTVKDYDRVYSKESAMKYANPVTGAEEYVLPNEPDAASKTAQLIANGYQPIGQEDVWAREDKELFSGPKLQYIRFEDYVWSPNAKRDNRLYWEGDRFWMTVNDIRLRAMQETFDKDAAQAVIDKRKPEGKEGAEKDIAVREKKVECFHWYGRLPFNEQNEIAFDDDNAIEQEVYVAVSYEEEEVLQILHWYHKRQPYPDRVYIRGEYEETENFEGRSIPDKLYMTQKELNKLHNTIINNAMIAMQKIFVKQKSLQDEGFAKPMVYPGAVWEENIPGEIRALDVGDVKAIGLELEQTLLNFAERLSNISIYQTGTARQEGGNKTKGEVDATIGEGNIGLDKVVQRCFGIMRKIAQWTLSYYQEDMPPGLERRIRGDAADPLFPTENNMALYQQKGINPYWSADDLTGKFDFTWNATGLNNSRESQIALSNDLMQRYLPHPMIAGNLMATWDILRRGLIARGIKDWQNILPKREAILQEMQRKAMEPSPMAPQPGATLGNRPAPSPEVLPRLKGANVRQPV